MSSIQSPLSEYLQCELYHSLGAYRVAEKRLEALADELKKVSDAPGSRRLLTLVEYARDYNKSLARHRHASRPALRTPTGNGGEGGNRGWPTRDPLPKELPLTRVERFEVGTENEDALRFRREPWRSPRDWDQVPSFYSEAIEALNKYEKGSESADDLQGRFRQILAESLITPRDGGTGWDEDMVERRRLRLDRYKNRRREAHIALSPEVSRQDGIGDRIRDQFDRARRRRAGGEPTAPAELDLSERYKPDSGLLEQIATEHLGRGDDSLVMFVVRAQAEAHLSMHAVEAWKAMCLGEHSESLGEEERDWLDEELDRSIALSTFAYCVSRTAPWLFAKDDAERKVVLKDIAEAWENVVPPRCMWIANQVGLLALHRRAYARSLQGDGEKSYNDYHKLQQLIRDAERRVRSAPIHVEGALEFLAGLNAEAHHHIGELYRAEHAHKPALKHFEAASHRLGQLRDGERVPEVLVDSRWNVELHISRGKACYEMGRQKEALCWYLHAWGAFLELFATGSQTETNTEAIEDAISWLDSVKFEPELRKSEVSDRLRPVVDQLDRITAVGQLGALAAEILLRLGHLLFVLNVGFDDTEVSSPKRKAARERDAKERVRRTLAFGCLVKAAECDPHSTLAGADLLKASFRLRSEISSDSLAEHAHYLALPEIKPIGHHWPRGGDDYEQLARIAEYMLLEAHAQHLGENGSRLEGDADHQVDAMVARDLLLNLFMSTDSINVRKAQIHRFLMKNPVEALIPGDPAPAIEFICMRRYSSPFPLLPRPSAFRALGGGYFLRLHGTKSQQGTGDNRRFGVVVDPGVDFVENLYRTGYSLSDIDMIVLTHDHVDHLGALDPLLSLLHVRSELLSKQAKRDEADGAINDDDPPRKPVKVLMSPSVEKRYKHVKRLQDSAEFEFKGFEKMIGKDGVLDRSDDFFKDFPEPFEIVAMSSAAGQGEEGGHRDLSLQPSHGLCFRVADGKGPSLAFTSDTPSPPSPESSADYEEWRRVWEPALKADVLVAHLGSVPLTELRRMDQADGKAEQHAADEPEPIPLEEKNLAEFQGRLQTANKRLRGQIEYAQWLRSHVPENSEPLTAPLVGLVPQAWLPPTDHNYLTGLLAWARTFGELHGAKFADRDCPPSGEQAGRGGLFIVGELSEELASMRGKIASRLNQWLFDLPHRREGDDVGPITEAELKSAEDACRVLTADIGLHICITPVPKDSNQSGSPVKVLCTTCNLDTDRAPGERYHTADNVYEVCVKGENEGIFYNCLEHDPTSQDDPTFLEQLERFDIFGR